MSTSETVQADQRLEIGGTLVAMGGEVPRLEIECDNGQTIVVGNLPAALLSEMPMLLYKRVRLVVEADPQPAPAAAPEGAERAAYLERWRNAPTGATHLAQDSDGECWFYEAKPILDSDNNWFGAAALKDVESNLLGSVRCEPRPVQGVEG